MKTLQHTAEEQSRFVDFDLFLDFFRRSALKGVIFDVFLVSSEICRRVAAAGTQAGAGSRSPSRASSDFVHRATPLELLFVHISSDCRSSPSSWHFSRRLHHAPTYALAYETCKPKLYLFVSHSRRENILECRHSEVWGESVQGPVCVQEFPLFFARSPIPSGEIPQETPGPNST